jgi:hypothetical protein
MADHGEVEYASVTGNNYEEHEGTYEGFLLFASIAVGCTVKGVLEVWWAIGLFMLLSVFTAFYGLATHSHTPGIVVLVLALLALAAFGLGLGHGSDLPHAHRRHA